MKPLLYLIIGMGFLSFLIFLSFQLTISKSPKECTIATQPILLFHNVKRFNQWFGGNFSKYVGFDFKGCPAKCNFSVNMDDYCSAMGVMFEGNTISSISQLPSTKPLNQKWFFLTHEPKRPHFEELQFQSFFDQRIMSYEPDSFAPLPAFHLDLKKVKETEPAIKDASKPVVAFISNCVPARMEYVRQLQQFIDIETRGRCFPSSTTPPDGQGKGAFGRKMDVISHYKFFLAFENSNLTDYVTEKLEHGFNAVTLPIYMGAPNIEEFLPHPHSVVKTKDFANPRALAKHLHFLLSNQTAYDSYFEWRKLPLEQLQVPKSLRPRNCKHCNHNWMCRTCLRISGLV